MGEKISGAVLRVETGGIMRRSRGEGVAPIMGIATMKEEVASGAELEATAEETFVAAVATTRMAVEVMADMGGSEVVVEEWVVVPEGAEEDSGGRA